MAKRSRRDMDAMEALLTAPQRRDSGPQVAKHSNAELFSGKRAGPGSGARPSVREALAGNPFLEAVRSQDYADLLAEAGPGGQTGPSRGSAPPFDDAYAADMLAEYERNYGPLDDEPSPLPDSSYEDYMAGLPSSPAGGDYPGKFVMDNELMFKPEFGPAAGQYATLGEGFDASQMGEMGEFLQARRPAPDPMTAPPGPDDTVDLRGQYVPKAGAPPLKVVDLGRIGGKYRYGQGR